MPNSKHPKFVDFMKHEKYTLEWLTGNSTVISNFRELTICAGKALAAFPTRDRLYTSFDFEFSCKFPIIVGSRAMTIILESLVTRNFGIATYCMSICKNSKKRLYPIRKFHFDYAIPSSNDPNPKPVYHLQYGGKPTPALTELSIDINHLYPWLSSPRVWSAPINLALLLDMMFCEFRDTASTRLTELGEWRDLIKKNEAYLLSPYYENLNKFLIKDHSSKYLLREFNYGIERN
jgi:hypothetical protein